MNRHHKIDYIEFTVQDLAQAMTFYGDVFGWEFTSYGPAYAGIRVDDGEVGGFAETGEPSEGGNPLVVLRSEDLDASLAAVVDGGGTIIREPFDFPGGRRFHFQDPSGNELAVWSVAGEH